MRLLAALVVIGSLPVLAPPASAAAASTCDSPVRFTAHARADLLKVSLLDLRPLGLNLPQVANLTLARSSAGMASDEAVRSRAEAEYIDAEVLGLKLPRGPLEAKVAQIAPPTHDEPDRNNALAVDLGLARAGTGDLLAHARWADGMTCGTQVGRAGSASAALLEATVLPGAGGPMVRVSRNLSSQAATALLARDGRAASAAAAEVGLAGLELLGTGSAAVVVRVINPPQLTAVATGRKQTSTVEYQSPILEISGPGAPTQRLDAPGKTIDIPLPANMLGTVLNGLGALVQTLPVGLSRATLLRLSLGQLQKQIGDREVVASAASLRLQLLTVSTAAAPESSLLDLSIGLLSASATAPQWVEPVPAGNPGCGTPACQLPKTGWKVTAAVAAGVMLFVLGRFLLVLTGRRASRRPPGPA
jgi:hypothetical protein